MAETAIEWTDKVWNPVRGCTKVSPGCANCYAETFAERWRGVKGHAYEQGFDLRLVPEKLLEPLSWKKPRRVFVNSMSDLFQDGVPDAFIDQVFAVMALAQQHTFQVLTKRAERMRDYMASRTEMIAIGFEGFLSSPLADAARSVSHAAGHSCWSNAPLEFLDNSPVSEGCRATAGWPCRNIWLGVSVENQHFSDERIPLLLQTPAALRFVSAEPLLESIDVRRYLRSNDAVREHGSQGKVVIRQRDGIDWLIVGGESGHGARPFDLDWAWHLKEQVDCTMGGTRLFIKQLGAVPMVSELQWHGFNPKPLMSAANHRRVPPDYVPLKFNSAKGGDMAEWPNDLRIREFPKAHS